MKTLTAATDAFPNQRAPTDGDPGSEATFTAPLQDAADRTGYLNALIRQTGVPRIQTVESHLELESTQANAGEVVMTLTGYRGLYLFVNDVLPQVDGFLYPSATPSDGTWMNVLWMLAVSGSDGVRFDSSVIAQANRIEEAFEKVILSGTQVLTTSGVWQATDVNSDVVALEVGDVVDLRGLVPWSVDDGTETMDYRLAAVLPSTSIVAISGSDVLSQRSPGTNLRTQTNLDGRFTATVAGNHRFRIQAFVSGGGAFNVTFHAPRRLTGLVIRP